MLKIFQMVSLYFLAAMVCQSTSLGVPPHLLLNSRSVHHVTVTAYTNTPQCTDGDHNVTASSFRIQHKHYGKIIALSRDLAGKYEFGDRFGLWSNGKLRVVSYEDRMPKKHRKKVDLLLPSLKSCKEFGKSAGILVPMDES
jgi:3D (Asp-Asp-Asp) domain-containing protein